MVVPAERKREPGPITTVPSKCWGGTGPAFAGTNVEAHLRSTTVLITGFGPFPGAPYNPTTALVHRLARLRRPALTDITVVAHIFPTSYAAIDRELPTLLARHKPDALLMFGLAVRAMQLRVERRARNTLTIVPDVTSVAPNRHAIAADAPRAMAMPAPAHRLLAAARSAVKPAILSQDAGRYLCNYLAWRAAEAVARRNGPRLAAFIHVPAMRRFARPRRANRRGFTVDGLARAGERLLVEMIAAARR